MRTKEENRPFRDFRTDEISAATSLPSTRSWLYDIGYRTCEMVLCYITDREHTGACAEFSADHVWI